MRVLLVPVADRPECVNALNIAFQLAGRLGASVCGCHIRDHRSSDVTLPSVSPGDVDSSVVRSQAAQDLFRETAARFDLPVVKKPKTTPAALWFEKVGSADRVLSIMAPVSDMLVVSLPKSKAEKPSQKFLLASLLNSSRPVLALPQSRKSSVGRRISIAWNQSPEAAQAIAAAIPLLRLAEQVTIITCGNESGIGPKSGQLANYLKFWGVESKHVRADEGVSDGVAILKAHHDAQSDLLVMGAYSRSRLRQRMFGGVTDFMLAKANIPIFMLHS